MMVPVASINVTLPLKYDNWYNAWSCMDDKDITAEAGKTFAFEYLIQGVIEAYETKNKDYINLNFNLNK